MPFLPLPPADLDHVLDHAGGALRELAGERTFLTGGTAFFGTWLAESFLWANARLGLRAKLVVLSRDPDAFVRRLPHLARCDALEIVRGDMTRFDFPSGRFGCVVHAATEPQVPELPHGELFVRNVAGTRRVLDFAASAGAARMLFTSSGAVYGTQPPTSSLVGEEYSGAPDATDPRTAYGQSKRASEHLCTGAATGDALQISIARCFAFVGPHLPLDSNFAIGNFIRDAIRGGPILVAGDGTPRRSYLHGADLAIWLWTILLRGGNARAYNVGSPEAVSIAELAQLVVEASGSACEVRVARSPDPSVLPARYVPDTSRAARELELAVRITLPDALARTIAWLRAQPDVREPT